MSVTKEFTAKLSTDGSTFTLTVGSREKSGEKGGPSSFEGSHVPQEFAQPSTAIEAMLSAAKRWEEKVVAMNPVGDLFS